MINIVDHLLPWSPVIFAMVSMSAGFTWTSLEPVMARSGDVVIRRTGSGSYSRNSLIHFALIFCPWIRTMSFDLFFSLASAFDCCFSMLVPNVFSRALTHPGTDSPISLACQISVSSPVLIV